MTSCATETAVRAGERISWSVRLRAAKPVMFAGGDDEVSLEGEDAHANSSQQPETDEAWRGIPRKKGLWSQ